MVRSLVQNIIDDMEANWKEWKTYRLSVSKKEAGKEIELKWEFWFLDLYIYEPQTVKLTWEEKWLLYEAIQKLKGKHKNKKKAEAEKEVEELSEAFKKSKDESPST